MLHKYIVTLNTDLILPIIPVSDKYFEFIDVMFIINVLLCISKSIVELIVPNNPVIPHQQVETSKWQYGNMFKATKELFIAYNPLIVELLKFIIFAETYPKKPAYNGLPMLMLTLEYKFYIINSPEED